MKQTMGVILRVLCLSLVLSPNAVQAQVAASLFSGDCEQENSLDSGNNCNVATASRCCCWCPDPTGQFAWGHVVDLGATYDNIAINFGLKPGAGDASCVTTGYVQVSTNGVDWSPVWSQQNLSGWTLYTGQLSASSARYVRATTDNCSVDSFTVSVDAAPPPPPHQYGYPVEPYLPGSYAKRTFFKNQDHLGEDEKLVAKTPVRAIGPGRIVKYGPATGYGELVAVVEHDLGSLVAFTNAYGRKRTTRYILSIYGHIRKSQERGGPGTGLKLGSLVTKDTVLGYVNNSSHPDGLAVDPNGDGLEHLHLGIRLSSAATAKLRDPAGWFRGYERATSFGTDFAAGSVAIPILIGH